MAYNVTQVANSTGVLELMQGVNDQLTFGYFGTLMLISIYAIIFMTVLAKSNHGGKAFAVASFISFSLSIFLRALGLVGELAIFILLIASAIGVAMLKTE